MDHYLTMMMEMLFHIWSYDDIIDTVATSSYSISREIDENYTSFDVSLSVYDAYGSSSESIAVTITPHEPNEEPVADAGVDLNTQIPHDGIPGAGEACVVLDASLSSDSDNDELTITWIEVSNDRDETEVDGMEVCLSAGTYSYQLTVTDPLESQIVI